MLYIHLNLLNHEIFTNLIISCISYLIQPVFAADDHSLITPEMQNYIGYGAVLFTFLLVIVAMLVILRAFKVVDQDHSEIGRLLG